MSLIPTIIRLNESSNAKHFSGNHLIHKTEFQKARTWIKERVDKSEPTEKIRLHETISVFGSRGSGKTTFLLSLIDLYKKDEDIQTLQVIDPTLIEEKGHIFLTIISQIKAVVEGKLSAISCDSIESPDFLIRRKWEECLRRLSGGLPTIDGLTSSINESDWQDPEYIMFKGLTAVNAAAHLEENFNAFVKESLEIIGKKVFLVALDDIDIEFSKGWPVLETIRKYLTSSQIITIISGDLKLFSKAIRKKQWKNFGKALLKNEGEKLDKMNGYNDLVTEMETQYLQKTLKPERRIHLNTIYEKINIYNEEIEVSYSEDGGTIPIKDCYLKIFERFGIRNKYQAEAYISFLESLPVRTQIQFLIMLNPGISPEEFLRVNVATPFLSDIFEKQVDIDSATSNPKFLSITILRLLLREQDLLSGYQLQPTTDDQSLNSNYIALSLQFSQRAFMNPVLIFDYLIKIGYTHNLLTEFPHSNGYKAREHTTPSIEGLCEYAGIYKDKVMRDIVGSIIAYIESKYNPKEAVGIIQIPSFQRNMKGGSKSAKGRFDHEFKGESRLAQILGYIPLTLSQYLHKNEVIRNYSIYTLLATIGEFIEKQKLGDLSRGSIELSQVRTYPMLQFNRGILPTRGSNLIEEFSLTNTDEESWSVFSHKITKWIELYDIVDAVSPHLLGKIATRFHYTLNNMKTLEQDNIGNIFNMHIIAYMNAVLIEDVRENNEDVASLNLVNTRTSDSPFFDNLKVARSLKKYENSFSRWMLSCPLLLAYLNPSIDSEGLLVDYLLPDSNDALSKSIYPILKQVTMKLEGAKSSSKKSTSGMTGKPTLKSNRREERERAIDVLMENGALFAPFNLDVDRATTMENNEFIRANYAHLFEDKKLTSDILREFRKYLKNNSHLEIIQEWKQLP